MNQLTASLWRDEAFSAVLSLKSIPDIISTIQRDTSPPLFNILEHLWFGVFGSSEVSIRSLSFLFYFVSSIFVYKLVSTFWNKKVALLSAILVLANPFYFAYAFEGRMYSIMALGVSASIYFLACLLWNRDNQKLAAIGYVASCLWALYSHHFAIFAIAAQGIWLLKPIIQKDKKTFFKIFFCYIAVAVLYLPWLPSLYKQVTLVASGFWLPKPNIKDYTNLISTYLATNLSFSKLAYIPIVLTAAILLLRKWKEKFSISLFLISLFILPITIVFVISQFITPIFYERYLLYAIPPAMILLSTSFSKFSKILVGGLITLFLIVNVYYFVNPQREPFSDLATAIKTQEKSGDSVINWTPTYIWESKYYGLSAPIYVPEGQSVPFFYGTALLENNDTTPSIPTIDIKSKLYVISDKNSLEIVIKGLKMESIKDYGNLRLLTFTRVK